ncbi:hypothetical protein BGX27_003497 [Mortierella sp. AM989]|nr:hypothetical protein BGX27_003497 [Mortierella sp. AM989]
MTSPTAPPTLVTLPTEIFESILPLLSQSDLTQCVRVSREWNIAMVPYLWRTLAIGSQSQLKRFLTNEAQQALIKNAAFVHELHTVHRMLYDQFLPSFEALSSDPGVVRLDIYAIDLFANLRSLELHPLKHRRKDFDQDILALVRQNPALKRFMFNVEMNPKTLLGLITEHMPNLQDLDLFVTWRGDVKVLLENLPECIRTVRLREVYYVVSGKAGKAPGVEPGANSTTVVRHHALESLYIGGDLARQEEEVLVPFLESCSRNLKSFGGMGLTLFLRNARIARALSSLSIVWKELNQHFLPSNKSDANIAKVISFSSNWTKIDLHLRLVGPLASAAIVDNCEHLETLDIMDSGTCALSGFHLQAVLSKATRLKSLRAHWVLSANKITAADILSSEWATTSLEHVDLKIDVPRADEALPGSAAIQSYRSIQRQVLRRFGQQKNLQKLVIGGMAITPATGQFGHQLNCLEMTLENGLDELVNLKDLELLDIHHMDHRVGVPELEWMAENLPKLRNLIGMMDSLRPAPPEVREWIRTHQPAWR